MVVRARGGWSADLFRFSAVSLALLGATFASGCASGADGTPDVTGTSSSAIVNGTNSSSDDDAVVLLIHYDPNSGNVASCTGTLLAPNLVLTARHCVSNTVDQGFGCNSDGTLIQGSQGGTVTTDFDPATLYLFLGKNYPDFNSGPPKFDATGKKIFHTSGDNLCTDDIALVELDKKLAKPKIKALRLDSPPKTGEKITAIGWGVTTTSPMPAVRQRRTGILIDAVGPSDGDSTHAPVPPKNFEVGESICSGDSGGPAISEKTGSIVGVVSRGGNGQQASMTDPSTGCVNTGNFPASNNYTEVAAWKSFLESTAKSVGATLWLEGSDNPLLAKPGDSCKSGSDCGSGICASSACVAACTTDKDCGTGESCVTESNVSFCQSASNGSSGDGTSRTSAGCSAAPASETPAGHSANTLAFVALAIAAPLTRRRKK